LHRSVSALCKHSYLECCCTPSHSAVPLRAQTFSLGLNTGSSDLWFASTSRTTCSNGTPEFDPKKSSTLKPRTQKVILDYGSGSASGIIAQDIVSMGPFTVTTQVFGAKYSFISGSSVRSFVLGDHDGGATTPKPLPSVVTRVLLVSWALVDTFIRQLYKNLLAFRLFWATASAKAKK
jgi:hypothetical protein